jgi:hypothetical protein
VTLQNKSMDSHNDLPSIQLINCTPSPAKQLGTETRPVTGKDAQLDNGMHGQGGLQRNYRTS